MKSSLLTLLAAGVLFSPVAFAQDSAAPARKPPVPTHRVAPKHPVHLWEQGTEGTATVTVRIDERGNVVEASVESATQEAFGEAAVEAVREWKFEPAMEAGRPVPQQLRIPFRFNIPFEDLPFQVRFNRAIGREVFVEVSEPVFTAEELRARPRPTKRPPHSYPEELKGSGRNGMVRMKLVIDPKGQVVNPEILEVSDPVFILPALAQASLMEFEPTRKGGKPVHVSMIVPLRFTEQPQQEQPARRPARRPSGGGGGGFGGGGDSFGGGSFGGGNDF